MSFEFKGTQGEWHNVEYAGFLEIQDGEKYSDLNILDVEKVGRQVAEYNAKLICSAPELLEALKYVIKFGELSFHVESIAKEAINKALGL